MCVKCPGLTEKFSNQAAAEEEVTAWKVKCTQVEHFTDYMYYYYRSNTFFPYYMGVEQG